MKYYTPIVLQAVALLLCNTDAFPQKLRGSKNASSQIGTTRSSSRFNGSSFPQRQLRAFQSSCIVLSSKSVIGAIENYYQDFADNMNSLESALDETCIKEIHKAYKNELRSALISHQRK